MIHIACASDNNYCQHMGVMLCSLLENSSGPGNITIHIADVGIEDTNLKRLVTLINRYGSEARVYKEDQKKYSYLPRTKRITHAAYYRISFPELLKDSAEHVLYLDGDVIVKDDIALLWNRHITDETIISAVLNPFFDRHDLLEMPRGSLYFNSGVMLINIKKWLSENIAAKTIDFIGSKGDILRNVDQDGLNAVLYDHWTQVAPRWNMQRHFYREASAEEFDPDEFREARENPAIVHFTTREKPWHYMKKVPLQELYFDYLKRTPWKNNKYQDRTLKNILRKNVLIPLRKVSRVLPST